MWREEGENGRRERLWGIVKDGGRGEAWRHWAAPSLPHTFFERDTPWTTPHGMNTALHDTTAQPHGTTRGRTAGARPAARAFLPTRANGNVQPHARAARVCRAAPRLLRWAVRTVTGRLFARCTTARTCAVPRHTRAVATAAHTPPAVP